MGRAEERSFLSVDDLWRVAETNDIRAIERILSTGIDVDARNEHGTTALMQAVSHGRLQMVKALIARGADPNAVRNDNFTPLTLAAFFGYSDIVRLLVQAGAETDRVTRNGTSARMWASARTFQGVAKYLDEVQPIEPAIQVATEKQIEVTTEEPIQVAREEQIEHASAIEITDLEISDVEVPAALEDLAEAAPLVIDETLLNAPQPSMFARFVSLKGPALVALLLVITLAVIAMLSRRSFRNDLRETQPTPISTSASESKVANVASGNPTAVEVPAKDTPKRVRVFDEAKTRRDNGHVARTSKRRFADDREGAVRKVLKPARKNDVVSAAVVPAPVPKQSVSPLSTQLVSSPSKAAPKPKVIQWP
jgi:Ankyrin repeats (3 copies)